MTVVLFCELSGSLVVTAADLNHIASTLCLPNFCMLSRETAIAFEDDAEKAASLVSEGTYRIDGRNLVFSRGEDFPSRFLEIHLSHQRYELEITGIVQNLKTAQVASISPRMPTILLEFKLQSEAVYGYIELKKLLSEHQSINSINLVPISDHNQVTCTFQKHLKFDETSYPLNVTEAVIQGVFSNANFESTPQTTTHELVDVIVTCPTEYDAAILRRLQADDSPPWHFIATPDKSGTILISDASNDRHSGDPCLVALNSLPENVLAERLEDEKSLVRDRRFGDEKSGIVTVINLDLECYAIANYFKLLLKWGAEAASSLDESADGHKTENGEENTKLLWGEDPELIREKRRELSTVTVVLENKAKLYGLIISSSSKSEASARMARMEKLADTAVRMRQTIPMKAWCPQHREAINESEALRDLLVKTRSAVLFHESKDRVISADVVGLTEHDQKVVRIFLEALIPRQGEWIVPQDCVVEYTAANWVDVRRKFAIKLDVKGGDKRSGRGSSGSQKGTKSLKVWGFEPSMEKALKHILASSTNAESVPLSLLGSSVSANISLAKMNTIRPSEALVCRKIRAPSESSRGQDEDGHDDIQLEIDFNMKTRDSDDSGRGVGAQRTPFSGHYVFLDREAGMLYQAFEPEFQAYLLQTFNVIMKSSQSTQSENTFDSNNASASSRTAPTGPEYPYNSQMQYRTPALRVEYGGKTKKDIGNVRIYMEKISSVNLSRRQIHFPRYDAMRYRELYNQKSKQEANVRMIRRHAIQQANMVGKDNRKGNMINNGLDFYRDKSDIRDSDTSPPAGELMPDPLLTVGFINIRIRPPLHSRGIRRMTFPAEITITVCSPVNTEPQLADYKTLCEHFMAMDSHFITASVELPLANKLAKEIIVRATREEFISKYGLVSLRWDENSLKRDNNAGSILASSSYDETANRQQDISPRLRSASESNREDVQIGVAKLWATKPDIMKIALDRLCKAEGIIISVSIGDKTHSDAFDSGGSSSGAISLSDILPASSATGKFRINPGKISPVQSPLLGINSRTVSLSNDYCDVSNQTQKSTCPLEIAYESTLAAEIVNSPDSDRSKSFSGVPPGFLPFTPPHNDFNFFPESSVVRPSAPLDTMSASSSLSPDSEPMSYLLSRLGEDQGFREVNADLGGFNVKQRVSGPPKFAYSRYPSGSEHETPSQPISRSNSTTKSIFGYGYGMETAPKFSLLAASNEQLPLDIKAAPGLNIPTDWDHLFEKADYRTSPSGTIPRTVAGSNSSRNMLSNSDFDQFSPKYNIKQAFSYDGFNAMPFSSQSPISAFAPFARDRAYSMTSIQKENSNSRDSSDLLPTGSIWNENLLRDSGQSFAPIRDTDIRFGSGSSIFNDGITSGRRMSLDLGEIAGDRSRLTGNSSFESTPRLSARQGHSEQLPQSYQQIHHEQFQARQQQVTTTPVENRLVVHWPHPSLRFMFLGDPLKYQLSDLLHKLRARGVGISTPFRDKTNASACLVIEGTVQGVAAASAHVESFFRTIISQVCSVKMILTASHREKLTAADLSRVKEIQGSAGAHIVLDPQLDEIAVALSCFDLRLPSTEAPQRATNVGQSSKIITGGEAGLSPSGESIPLVSILVISQSGLGIEVSTIINRVLNPSRYGDKSWGTSSLLMLIDSTAYAELNQDEKRNIDKGNILVNRDPITGKIIIRVWTRNKQSLADVLDSSDFSSRFPWKSDSYPETSDDVTEYQSGVLIEALSDGLAEIDALNITHMALIVPIGNKSLSALSPDLIRTIAVEITVNFIKLAHLQSLQKIVCVDLSNGDIDVAAGPESTLGSKDMFPRLPKTLDFSAVSVSQKNKAFSSEIPQNSNTGEAILLPASGNRMALTLLLLLDQATSESKIAKDEARMRSYNPNSLIPLGRQEKECFYRNIGGERQRDDLIISEVPPQKMFLLACNVPLPCSLSAEAVCPEIILRQKQQRVRDRTAASTYSGFGFNSNVVAPFPIDGSGHNRQRDYLRDQISDYRDHAESGQDNPCIIMLKGLPSGILKAVRAIKLLVTTK